MKLSFDQKVKIIEGVMGIQFTDWLKNHLRMLCEDENTVFMYSRGCGKTLLKRAYVLMRVLDKLEEENEEW